MSADYRPRSGGGEGGSRSGGGGRRRRGGRGRGGHGRSHSHDENRVHTNGGTGHGHTPKKKESVLSKLFGWIKGKGKKDDKVTTPLHRPASTRPEYKEREPRAERAERPPRAERPAQAEPPPQEITSPKLYVGNLSYEAAESDLYDLFAKVGSVKNVEIAMDRRSNRSKGFGFVEMEVLETAKEAAAKLNRTDFMGRQIVVSGAKTDKRLNQSESRDEDTTSHDATGTGSDTTI